MSNKPKQIVDCPLKPYEVFKTVVDGKMIDVVMITAEQYRKLNDDQDLLVCLQGCGVSSWEGYSDAQDMFEDR